MPIHNDRKIAVVGLGALFPDAENIDQFWQNITSKKVSIKPLPDDILESDIYYRPELFTAMNKQEKTITRVAARIENLSFDTVRRYKIPPSVAEHMDENQHAALETASQALQMNTLGTVAKDRVGVIFGNGMVGTQYGDALVRVQFQLIEHYLRGHESFRKLSQNEQENIIEYVRSHALKGSLPISEDSAPGILPNIIAARISNVFDFHGPSFTVDAACASVLAAIIKGIQALYLNELDAVICGGADMPLKQLGFIFFSAINALSPDGSFPFDKRANGFVMGQGAGSVVLKRLEDAVRDKDTILAVVTGYGEASDGKGKYIAAPNAEWQAKAIEKACLMAGYSVDTIQLIEAHGTATVVGDVVEVEGLKKAFANLGSTRKNYCGLTSVKSNIGHLKSAAGIAGFIKAALALHHKKLPPTASFQEINPKLQIDDSPFYIVNELADWQAPEGHPRRANVSSFGFGGADYHIALEEYDEAYHKKTMISGFRETNAKSLPDIPDTPEFNMVGQEIFICAARDREELHHKVTSFIENTRENAPVSFQRQVRLFHYNQDAASPVRLAILASSAEELESKYETLRREENPAKISMLQVKGIYFKESEPLGREKIAIMFPGQASQYLHMFRNIYDRFETVRSLYEQADARWIDRHGFSVTALIFPETEDEKAALETLKETRNAHPAIFMSSIALFELFKGLGLDAKYMTGHSLGEITALAAAGKISMDDALTLVDRRGYSFHDAGLEDTGKMISILGDMKTTQEQIDRSGVPVTIANINSPRQTIVAGKSKDIDNFKSYLDKNRISSKVLFVSHAFHSAVVDPVADQFYNEIKSLPFQRSDVRVMMNHSGNFYPNTAKDLKNMPRLLKDQILKPVNFVQSIRKLYEEGVRLFVEMGPGLILSNLCKDILDDKDDITILTSNFKNKDDVESLQKCYAGLFSEGVPLKPLPSVPGMKHSAADEKQTLRSEETREDQTYFAVRHSDEKPVTGHIPIVFSGVSVGLPGSHKESFRDDNFEQIFRGHNFIERMTDAEKKRMVDLQITKLVKDERGPSFKLLESLDDVIQLAGKIGRIDMLNDYRIDEKDLEIMSSSISLGVAAGYEALKDAHIPLVQEYIQTSTGKRLPQKLTLPEYMQEETGVIFANGFPMIDPVIEEVSRYISFYYGSKTRRDLMEFYEKLLERIKDNDTRKLLTDWYTLHYSRFTENPGVDDVYQFNYNFMMQISAQANNRLASLIKAKGPNFQMNAACSSTSNAITIAEDFIRSGRVKRMIIVGADDPTCPTNFPWLGAGFLCTGAATNEGDLYKAAVPFDLRRNGMIISAGAVGVVLETKAEIEKRGINEVCELLGTHSFNTASHPSQIDTAQFSKEMKKFIGRMEQWYDLTHNDLPSELLYISHETYTPARGGCSQTEAEALKMTFGEKYTDIVIGNTKGMTGHAMGAALEDAVTAKALQLGKIPPVVNHHESDPMLAGLNLSRGGSHDRAYALKMSAGFGSQGNFSLLKKTTSGENRIGDPVRYEAWLKSIAGSGSDGRTAMAGRLFVLKDPNLKTSSESDAKQQKGVQLPPIEKKHTVSPAQSVASETSTKQVSIAAEIINLIASVSSYPEEMLETDMEIEADLGLSDEVQQNIRSALEDRFNIDSARLNWRGDVNLGNLIEQVKNMLAKTNMPETVQSPSQKVATDPGMVADKEAIRAETVKVFSEVTKYPEDMLEMDMEMEADLGIDTVKQATILSILGEKYMMERDDSLQLSNYPTIGHIVDLVYEKSNTYSGEMPEDHQQAEVAEEETPVVMEEEFIPETSDLTRQVVILEESKRGKKKYPVRNRLIWLVADDETILRPLKQKLQAKKAKVRTLVLPENPTEFDPEEFLSKSGEKESPDVIIDVTHCGTPVDFATQTKESIEHILQRSGEYRFRFYKALAEQNRKPGRILCVTSVDGYLGYHDKASRVTDPSFGALIGFYKALRKEWADSHVSILDVEPDLINKDENLFSETVITEMEYDAPGFEAAVKDGHRRIAKITEKKLQRDQTLRFTESDTILITGGGTGLGSRVFKAMARRYPSRFIVVDIVNIPDEIEEYVRLDEAGLEKLRRNLREDLKKTRQKVTPVMVNREFEAITRAVDVYNTLTEVKSMGRHVTYIACDVRDYEGLQNKMAEARREMGAVTAVIHAAGLEKSHFMDRKSAEEFRDVFSVKATGASHIMLICKDDPLKLVVAFSSISGRFGNAAQLDYSAANSFLNYWIKMLQTNDPGLHALSLIWSGWKDVGMAWRNPFVRETSEEIGLNFIEIFQGLSAFFNEIEHRSGDTEVLLHRGLDGFLEPQLSVTPISDFPLIDRITPMDGNINRAYRMLSVRRDAMLDQHRLGKVPIMPAVGYSELAAEYYALHEGKKEHYVLRNITFSNAFKLFHEEPRELFIEGHKQSEDGSWEIEIKSVFRLPKTNAVQTILHSRSRVSSALKDYSDMDPANWHIDQRNPVELSAEESLLLIKDSGVDQRIILGPLFNDVLRDSESKEPVLIYPKSTIYPTYFPKEQLSNPKYPLQKMLVNPCFLDSIYQACAAHLLVNKKRVYLPWEVGELGIIHVPRGDGLYRSYTNVAEDNEEIVSFNVAMTDGDGRICYYGRNVQFRRINL